MKKYYIYFLFVLCVTYSKSTLAQQKNPTDIQDYKMKIIFIDSTTCRSVKADSHWGGEDYFLVLCQNISGKIDSLYTKYLIVRIFKSDLELISSKGDSFYLSVDMHSDLTNINRQLKIVGKSCKYLLNENIDHIFKFHQ